MINWRSNYAFTLHREDNSRWSEAKLILGSFLIILLVGTLFLVQPSSHKGEVTVINALFTATRGRGAFLNDRRIRVSKRTQLKECLISTGFPFRPGDNFNQYLLMMGDVMQKTAGLRRPGSAALDLAYVAAGFTEAFFETGLSPWDVAAGSLLVTEAGGLVGNFTGESDFLEQREMLAGTPRIYGQLVPILHKYSKFAGAGEKAEVREASRKLTALKRSETADATEAQGHAAAGEDTPL